MLSQSKRLINLSQIRLYSTNNTKSLVSKISVYNRLYKLTSQSSFYQSYKSFSPLQQEQKQRCLYSTSNNTTVNAELALPDYHTIVDDELELFSEKLETLIQSMEDRGTDIEHSDGVLTVNLATKGTYVINKQTPNRQIWWSSPISGPKRFDYNINSKQWVDNRDGTPLRQLLQSEIKVLCKYDLNLD